MNLQLESHLASQGIEVGASQIIPCWKCMDEQRWAEYQPRIEEAQQRGNAYELARLFDYAPEWHPWHNWPLLWRLFKHCHCQACNGTGRCISTRMTR